MQLILFSVVLPTIALAAGFTPHNNRHMLPKRQSGCDAGEVVCGEYCIMASYTCCPDQQGGCPAGEECQMGDNGQYGCCDAGETCTGDGGVNTDYDFSSIAPFSFDSSATNNYATTTDSYDSLTTSDSYLTDEPTTTTARSGGSATNGGGQVTVTASGNAADAVKYNGGAAAFVLGLAALL